VVDGPLAGHRSGEARIAVGLSHDVDQLLRGIGLGWSDLYGQEHRMPVTRDLLLPGPGHVGRDAGAPPPEERRESGIAHRVPVGANDDYVVEQHARRNRPGDDLIRSVGRRVVRQPLLGLERPGKRIPIAANAKTSVTTQAAIVRQGWRAAARAARSVTA